jgi:hypothetical protein
MKLFNITQNTQFIRTHQQNYSVKAESKNGINPERDFLISQNTALATKSLTHTNELNQISLPQSITNYFHKD